MQPKIGLAMPSRETVCLETMHSVVNLVGRFSQLYIASGQAQWVTLTVSGTLLPQMRNTLVKQAIGHECTHVLWVDSDMQFPADSLERLLKHNVPIVGANYSQRKRPAKPTTAVIRDGQRVWAYEGEGIEECHFLGHGLTLVETAVYEALPMPWYMLGWNEAEQREVGEDVYFCQSLARIQCPLHVDHDLSREVKHIGSHAYSMDDAIRDRPMIIAEQRHGADDLQRASGSDRELAEPGRPDSDDPGLHQPGGEPDQPSPQSGGDGGERHADAG